MPIVMVHSFKLKLKKCIRVERLENLWDTIFQNGVSGEPDVKVHGFLYHRKDNEAIYNHAPVRTMLICVYVTNFLNSESVTLRLCLPRISGKH